mgnify:CR=1 FL=1
MMKQSAVLENGNNFLKSKTMRKGMTEMAIEVFCKKEDTSFMEKIRAVEAVNDVTLIQYNGEYHG